MDMFTIYEMQIMHEFIALLLTAFLFLQVPMFEQQVNLAHWLSKVFQI